MERKWTALFALMLIMSVMVSSVCAASDQKDSSHATQIRYSTPKFHLTTDPIKNQELIKSYGTLALNDNISHYLNSQTYSSSDYILLNSFPSQKNSENSNFYGVVRYYKAKDAGKHKVYVLEQVATASGITQNNKSSGISELEWTSYYSSEGGSISLTDYSPQGTTKQSSKNTFNWSINPSVEGISLGSIGGSFQLDEGMLVGKPSTNIFTETWSGSPVVHPANVAQQGASAWFVQNGEEPNLIFYWDWNWTVNYWY
ncbi:hypothetical protein PAALTS15_00850 [Paenibacillus alvei TS-15]|uniref:Uncharacterized protein n=1 Tax=Paenibacillus alvei TS-15 TaxID=1117108 RepID=S9SWZ9_PAEAL|nr:hypothetical protein [Paenibacillus alvei]EPY09164.1 hypothetical protein PAALTS15_00850 [Paenibacillus alvei TS-15]